MCIIAEVGRSLGGDCEKMRLEIGPDQGAEAFELRLVVENYEKF